MFEKIRYFNTDTDARDTMSQTGGSTLEQHMRFMNDERRELLVNQAARAATYDFVYDFATYVCAAVAWFFYDPILTPIGVCASMLYGSRSSGRGVSWLLPVALLGERLIVLRLLRNSLVFIGIGIGSGIFVAAAFEPSFAGNVAVQAFLESNMGVFLLAFVAGLAETYAHVRRFHQMTATHSELASALATATPLAASVTGGMIGAGNAEGAISAGVVVLVNIGGLLLGSALWLAWQRLRWHV
jgi:hypothetical protein